MKEEIRCGKYRHFKGNEYEVIGVAHHSETMEEMVVYRALYGEGGLWVRPASMWNETVERDGKQYQRFTYIGDEANEGQEKKFGSINEAIELSVVLEAYEEATNDWTYYYDLEKHENIYIFTSSFMDDEEERELVAAEPDRFIKLPKKDEIYSDERVREALKNGEDLEAIFTEMALEYLQSL